MSGCSSSYDLSAMSRDTELFANPSGDLSDRIVYFGDASGAVDVRVLAAGDREGRGVDSRVLDAGSEFFILPREDLVGPPRYERRRQAAQIHAVQIHQGIGEFDVGAADPTLAEELQQPLVQDLVGVGVGHHGLVGDLEVTPRRDRHDGTGHWLPLVAQAQWE